MEKKCSFLFVIGIALLEFANVFALSGYAESINYTILCTYLCIGVFLAKLLREKRITPLSGKMIFIITSCGTVVMILNIFLNWTSSLQLTNFLTLFGIVAWVNGFSKIQWNEKRFLYVGIVSCVLAITLIYLFLPGNFLSGWNSNSSISVLPILLFGLSCLFCSKARNKYVLVFIMMVMVIPLLLSLENRSSFFTLVIFLIIIIVNKLYKSRIYFRLIYCSAILINVCVPFLYKSIVDVDIFQRISDIMTEIFGKDTLLNGRENVWDMAVSQISQNILMGTAGIRTTYYHNFSLDVLTQFGWIGWIVYIILLVVVLEKGFKTASKYNIFLIVFACVLFLNTFENVLVCNNYFMVFTYMLLAVPWSLHFNQARVNNTNEE